MVKRIAGIDIGSNTILMLIADIDSYGNLKVIRDENSIARLGEGVNDTKTINSSATERACKILQKYKNICINEKVDIIAPVATSAMRDAINRSEIADIFSNILDTDVKIISGGEEARLTFIGTAENADKCTIMDIGGGSTEYISGENYQIDYKISIDMGAVRVKEKFFSQHPPTDYEIENAKNFIIESLDKVDKNKINEFWYAVAGSPTSIAAIYLGLREFDYEKIHLFELNPEIISSVWKIIMTHSVQEIIDKYNMHPKRADIISAGVLILKTTLEYFNINTCTVSVKGLRYGIVKNLI